ncbi:transglutaminase-like cysteine peptidase [Bosea thiooxidans]
MRNVAFSRASGWLVIVTLLTGLAAGAAQAAGPLKPGTQAGPNLRFFTLAERLAELRRSSPLPEPAASQPASAASTELVPETRGLAPEPAALPVPAREMLLDRETIAVPGGELAAKWAEMAARWQADKHQIELCADTLCGHAGIRRWLAIRAEAGALDGAARLSFVNRALNRSIAYATDFQIHGEADRWSSPLETVERAGDCEDYVIAKYLMLRELGFEPEALRLVALFQPASGQFHAILAVRQGEDWLFLDNQQAEVATAERYRGTRPIATVNEAGQALFLTQPSYRIAAR